MREFNSYLTQAFNMKNFDLNGKVEFQTAFEKSEELKEEIAEMKKRGEI